MRISAFILSLHENRVLHRYNWVLNNTQTWNVQLTEKDVQYFRSILGDNGVVTDAKALEPLNEDWLGAYRGQSKLALFPRSTQQVSQILAYCNPRRCDQ